MNQLELWRRTEEMVISLLDERGTSRSALSSELGMGINVLGRYFRPGRSGDEEIVPRFDLAFQVLEHLGIDPAPALAGLDRSLSPESLLAVLPVGSRGSERRQSEARRTDPRRGDARRGDARRVREFLSAAQDLELSIHRMPEVFSRPWTDRRFHDPVLRPIYRDLESLEARRFRDTFSVAEICRREIVGSSPESASAAQAVRLIGLLGIWGTIHRTRGRLGWARDALSLSVTLARKLGDQSLLANQLQRAGYALSHLDAARAAQSALREASERFDIDGNEIGHLYTLTDRGVLAFYRGEPELAERLYRAALRDLPPRGHWIQRNAAIHGIASCYEQTGRSFDARAYLHAALEDLPDDAFRLRASIYGRLGLMERQKGRPEKALPLLRDCLELLHRADDSQSILSACFELAVTLLLTGRRSELSELRVMVRDRLSTLADESTGRRPYELFLCKLLDESLSLEDLDAESAEILDWARVSYWSPPMIEGYGATSERRTRTRPAAVPARASA